MANNNSSESLNIPEDNTWQHFNLFFTVVYLLPIFTVNILLLVGIISDKTVPVTVRVVLGNIVTSSDIIIFGLIIWSMYEWLLVQFVDASPHDFPCRLASVLISSGSAGGFLYMATYAITVYVLARYAGTKLRVAKLRLWHALLAVVVIWLFATVPNMVLFSPEFYSNITTSDYNCDPQPPLEYSISFIFAYGVCCFVISIIVPIVTIRYIKKNSISENKETLKRMTKFSIFLLIGNSFNVMGILPLLYFIFALYPQDDYEDGILVWVFYILVYVISSLSLLITPFNILIFFKQVRKRFIMLLCCSCLKVCGKCGQRQLSGTNSTML